MARSHSFLSRVTLAVKVKNPSFPYDFSAMTKQGELVSLINANGTFLLSLFLFSLKSDVFFFLWQQLRTSSDVGFCRYKLKIRIWLLKSPPFFSTKLDGE